MSKKFCPFRLSERSLCFLAELQRVFPEKTRTGIVESAIEAYHIRNVDNPKALYSNVNHVIQPEKNGADD